MTISNTNDRCALEDYLGQQVAFRGLIVNTRKPAPDKHFICLRKMCVGRGDDAVRFHHMWLDVSGIQDISFRIASWLTGSAYVKHYHRKDGSESYGICAPSDLAAA